LGIAFFIHKGVISAVTKVEFFTDRMLYVTLRGHWCDITILNVHEPTEDKSDYMKDSFYEEPEHVFNQFPKYHMKILSDFKAKVGIEDIFKPSIKNESSYEISNDNGVRIINFATSRYVIVKSILFPYLNIHKCACTSSDGKT
jgi:hypothetical protein